jgi:predicted Holliday junction resolvase-like endonuclease
VDVKSGAARLAPKQKVIKQVVESGKVKFEVAKAGGKK